MEYKDLNDNELLSYIAEGNEDANNIIIKKYEPLITSMASRMLRGCPYLGIELSDLIQEGMIGLNHATSYYNEQKDITFFTYAKTCIERKLISYIISAKTLKNKNLNDSISFDGDDEGTLEYLLKDDSTNPENIVMSEEETKDIINDVKAKLTDLESQVFDLMLSFFNYREIAELLDKEPKQIDNAIYRIKVKVRESMAKYEGK
jgi:RNA polymerase sporulation-specific sigma factor